MRARGVFAGYMVVSLLAAPMAQANSSHSDESRTTAGAARHADAESIARKTGESMDVVLAALEHQDELDRVLRRIHKEHPKILIGSQTTGLKDPNSVVFVEGSAPEKVRRVVKESDYSIALRDGLQHTRDEAQEAEQEAVETIRRHNLERLVISTSAPSSTLSVTVPTTDSSGKSISRRDLERDIEASVPGWEVDVALVEDSSLLGKGEHTYGGGEALDDGNRECTTGFTVDLDSGDTGVVVAAHCSGINGYDDPFDSPYSMPWVDEHVGSYGDIELHTSTHLEPAEFYDSSSNRRDVYDVAATYDFGIGDWVCVYGRTSGYDCEQIYDVSVSYYPDSRRAYNMIAVESHITSGGDSGGPWFLGNTAYGVHSGVAKVDGVNRSVFTPSFNVHNAVREISNIRTK